MSFAGDIADICNDPSLKFDKLVPQKSESIAETMNIIPQIKRRDILLSYPYESIKPFIQLLNEAAKDPKVTDIKITLYRLAKNSQIIEALCDAAENGKNSAPVLTKKTISAGQDAYRIPAAISFTAPEI